jgi:hypothetical protein
MKVRNTHGLPQALVDAVSMVVPPEERREGADISVTEMLGPPRIKQLKDKHWDEVDIDASDRMHAVMGTAIHSMIARTPYTMSAVRLFARWQGLERFWTVSGEFDLLEDGFLWDFKPLRAAAVFDGPKPEWVEQLNVYRLLCLDNRIKVVGLKAVPYIRDYTPVERYRNKRYPAASMIAMDVPMWSVERARAFVQYRLSAHEEVMPECTNDERWAKPHEYALMAEGGKRAVALYAKKEDAEAQALARMAALRKKFYVQERQQESLRCKHYCDLWRWCERGRLEKSKVVESTNECE